MLKQKVLFVSGIITAIIYFLGFPNFWRMIILLIVGILVSICAVLNFYERKYLDQKIKSLEGTLNGQEKPKSVDEPAQILIEEIISQDVNEGL